MSEEKKYFGMTMMQIGILAGLLLALLCIVGVGAWMVLGKSGFGVSQPPPPLPPPPTVTLASVATPTIAPTATLTPIPYEQLIPSGWKQYKTQLIEIWMPTNFKKGDPKSLKDASNLAIPELAITEVKSKSSLYNMIVGVSYEPLTGNSLHDFLDGQLSGLPSNVVMVERKNVTVNAKDGVRIVFEIHLDTIDINDLAYVFLDGSTVWYVEYVAQINEFYDNLPIFEQSVKTFRMVR